MVSIILSGANGKMGHVVADLVLDHDDCKIVAGVDIKGEQECDFPVSKDFSGLSGDVIIDFSHPDALCNIIEFAKKNKTPIVLATTGYSKDQITDIKNAAKDIAIFFSFNMSLGINLLVNLAKKSFSVLGKSFDIEIVEKHHNQKIDAPSGTALMIADAINKEANNSYHYVYDRHSVRQERYKYEIGIHAVRGGTIVGEHEVIFAGKDEILTISHSARSKDILAVGAINAALFIKDKKPGLYDMNDLIDL